jgi:hypothetical protein
MVSRLFSLLGHQAVPANALVDSGFPTLTLPQVLYTQVVALLGSINPNFAAMIPSGFVPNSELNNFTEWLDICLTFAGVEGDMVLVALRSNTGRRILSPVRRNSGWPTRQRCTLSSHCQCCRESGEARSKRRTTSKRVPSHFLGMSGMGWSLAISGKIVRVIALCSQATVIPYHWN